MFIRLKRNETLLILGTYDIIGYELVLPTINDGWYWLSSHVRRPLFVEINELFNRRPSKSIDMYDIINAFWHSTRTVQIKTCPIIFYSIFVLINVLGQWSKYCQHSRFFRVLDELHTHYICRTYLYYINTRPIAMIHVFLYTCCCSTRIGARQLYVNGSHQQTSTVLLCFCIQIATPDK